MKSKIINPNYNIWKFELTNDEVITRIFHCLSKTNPELQRSDIRKAENSKEFKATFKRADGETVNVSVGINNLKRYFGAYVLAVTDDGIWFTRRMSKKFKGTEGEETAGD